jgi:hypothetical protein
MGMSTEEYERQKSRRFCILTESDAFAAGLIPEPSNWSSVSSYVVENIDGRPARVIGSDGGSPEDQVLLRDFAWVADALNEVAESRGAQSRPDSSAGSSGSQDRGAELFRKLMPTTAARADKEDRTGNSTCDYTSGELRNAFLDGYAAAASDPSLNVQPEPSQDAGLLTPDELSVYFLNNRDVMWDEVDEDPSQDGGQWDGGEVLCRVWGVEYNGEPASAHTLEATADARVRDGTGRKVRYVPEKP